MEKAPYVTSIPLSSMVGAMAYIVFCSGQNMFKQLILQKLRRGGYVTAVCVYIAVRWAMCFPYYISLALLLRLKY